MSGQRGHNFRQGDRSEYLATYMLSALGLVTAVPRQEDIGFDLICSIADQETGNLTFDYHYAASIKSASIPNINLKPSAENCEGTAHIDWLFRLDIPLFLVVVDKNNQAMSLFSTLPAWFIAFEKRKCGHLTLIPQLQGKDPVTIGRPRQGEEITQMPGFHRYEADLGYPIASMTISDMTNPDRIRSVKQAMRHAIMYARQTQISYRLKLPYFWWFHQLFPDNQSLPQPAYIVQTQASEQFPRFLQHVTPSLIHLAFGLNSIGKVAERDAVLVVLEGIAKQFVPENLWQDFAKWKSPVPE